MKTIGTIVLSLSLAAQKILALTTGAATDTVAVGKLVSSDYSIVAADGSSCVYERTDYTNTAGGLKELKKHQYVRLEAGMNHLVNGQWVPSSDEIVIMPDGTGAATNGQHQAYFPGNLNDSAITVVTPTGDILQSRPFILIYTDGEDIEVLGELQDSTGNLVTTNQVIYPDAFKGIKADVRYTYSKGGFEQDIILREQPPTPESLGLDPTKTKIEVLTEFFDPPTPELSNSVKDDSNQIRDMGIKLGGMSMILGKAFTLPDSDAKNSQAVTVFKDWIVLSGRTFLAEVLPFSRIVDQMQSLPQHATTTKPDANIKLALASPSIHLLPGKKPSQQKTSNPVMLAKVGMVKSPGLVLDYILLSGQITNAFTFQADTTYLMTGASFFELDGPVTFEGGTVIKFETNSAGFQIRYNTLNCQSSPYRPIILTAKDDDTVGEIISGSTGNPVGYYGNGISIYNNYNITLHDIRMSYLNLGFYMVVNYSEFDNVQVINCYDGINHAFAGITINNGLFYNIGNIAVKASSTATAVNGAHLTIDNCATFADSTTTALTLINSLVTATTNLLAGTGTLATNKVTILASNSGVYQTVGAGTHYLANGSSYRAAGTNAINATLLAGLPYRTTYPPVVYSNQTISISTNFPVQALRDTNASPDLGYHYDPLDYITDNLIITNATLTMSNGVAIACYNEPGIVLQAGSTFTSIGTPLLPNWLVRYQSVQDKSVFLGGTNTSLGQNFSPASLNTNRPSATIQFTRFAVPDNGGFTLSHNGNSSFNTLTVQHSEFWGGTNDFSGPTNAATAIFFNNLFFRSGITASNSSSTTAGLAFTNNLIYGSVLSLVKPSAGNWYFFNNDVDSSTVYSGTVISNGYNAFINCSTNLSGTGTITTTNIISYQTGTLGSFYQPTNSALINAGNANLPILNYFTTQTNQVAESNSVVDIGYHYVALNTGGNPLDLNVNGTPDYLEALGNQSASIATQPTNQTVIVSNSATFTVVATGTSPLSYQWWFGTNKLANATNTSLTINNAQSTNAGNYTVVVTNIVNSVTSSVATLTVLIPPSITAQPADLTVMQNGNASFSVTAAGSAPLFYQWYFRSTNRIAGATNASLNLAGVLLTNAGCYSVVITNSAGSVASILASLAVIAGNITNQTVLIGGNATLAVTVSAPCTCNGPYTYQWQHAGTNIGDIITTVAGNYDLGGGYEGDGGAATNAILNYPAGLTLDSTGNLYISDLYNNVIRKVGTNGIITTVVGNGSQGYDGDGGAATNANLSYPNGLAFDAVGNLYIADQANYAIRKVATNGVITTVAGNGGSGYDGDGGAATDATLNNPSQPAIDAAGNIYIADSGNGVIRKVDTNGIITTVAGNGTQGYSGDGGAATNATLNYPTGIALDAAGRLYIADYSSDVVRKVDTNGIITTVAGNGSQGYSGDNGPATNATFSYIYGPALDAAGNIYIADSGNGVIRKVDTNGIVTTVAGNGTQGFSGDGGTATIAALCGPNGLDFSAAKSLYYSDGPNNVVRQIAMDRHISVQGGTLNLLNATNNYGGDYRVVISSPCSSITSSVAILAVVPISITTQPTNLQVVLTSNATFSVVATGSAPLSYQWWFNATNFLTGATNSSFTLTNAQKANAGNYRVVITNIYGAITSSIAVLTVVPPIFFTNFCDVSSLQINGSSAATNTADGCVLQLTGSVGFQSGSAFSKFRISLANNASFSTFFSFRFSKSGGITNSDADGHSGADGMVFVVQTLTNNVGVNGGGIGYLGITNSVGIEFDTWFNIESGIADPNLPAGQTNANGTVGDGNHIAVDINGALNHSTYSHITHDLNNSNIWYAWIDYDGMSNLTVSISETNSRPTVATLTNTVNLISYLHTSNAYVGFTAATGGAYNQHDILSWQFITPYDPIGVSNVVSVRIASPSNQTFLARARIPVSIVATSTIPGVSVQQVQLFSKTTTTTNLCGVASVATNGVYQIDWIPTSGGTYALTAVAIDTRGSNCLSLPVTNTIRSLPTVVIVSPTNDSSYSKYPTNILIQANAVAGYGSTITNVSFLQGTNIIGSTTSGTANVYGFVWNGVTNGTYTLWAKAFDNAGGIGASSNISIVVASNIPPKVNAGADQLVNLWQTNAVQLSGAVSDDGLPTGALVAEWSCTGGSANVVFGNSNQPVSTAYFSVAGVYNLRLSVNDSQFAAFSNMTVTVISNAPPCAFAGEDQTIFDQLSAHLRGAVLDDGKPYGTILTSWSVLSGPGQVSFANAGATNTIAKFGDYGTYQLKLTANDGLMSVSSNVTITLLISNSIPYAATNWLYIFDDGTSDNTTNFFDVDYDDSFWTNGTAGFGNYDSVCTNYPTYNNVNTFWSGASDSTPDILLRRHFTVPPGVTNLSMGFTVDNDAQIFINGNLITSNEVGRLAINNNAGTFFNPGSDLNTLTNFWIHGGCPRYDDLVLNGIATNVWHEGDNVLAIHAHDDPSSTDHNYAFFDCRIAVNYDITIPPPSNQPPRIIFVDPYLTWTTTNNSVSLHALVLDDGLPQDGRSVMVWTNISGPGVVDFLSDNPPWDHSSFHFPNFGDEFGYEATTYMKFSEPGAYLMRLLVGDGEFTISNDVTVMVYEESVSPPVVDIVTPTNGSVYAPGTRVSILATAFAFSGTITNLKIFLLDSSGSGIPSLLASNATNSLTFDWIAPLVPGSNSLIAAATDSGGRVGYSPQITIMVASNLAPVVIANPSFVWTTNSAQLHGWVLDDGMPNGHVTALWTNTSGPGTVTFTNLPSEAFKDYLETTVGASFSAPGTYIVQLWADDGEFLSSNEFKVVVSSATNTPPTISITSPTNSAVFAEGASIPISASASATAGTVTNVDFYAISSSGKSFIGRDASSPFAISWTPALSGTYSVTATATDSGGRVGSSLPVSFQVSTEPPPVAGNDYFTVFANSLNNRLDVLTNDWDTNGYALKIISVTAPGNAGTATIVNGGKAINYTPQSGFSSTDDSGVIHPGDGFDYQVSNGHGGTAWGKVVVGIFASPTPQVVLTAANNTTNAGSLDPLVARILTPSQYITKVEFYLGDVLIGISTNGSNGYYTNLWKAVYKDCDCGFTATTYDAFGQAGTSEPIFINVTPPANGPGGTSIGPIAAISSYAAGSNAAQPFTNLVTIRDGMFTLTGQACHPLGSNDMVWQLGVYSQDGETLVRDLTPKPWNESGYHTGFVGTTNSSGILASNCDLTTLQNGVYVLRLVSMGGFMITNADVQFILDSNLKVGQFGFSQQDLVIPVNGIPLTVTRTYNSLNPDKGDFGYGWTYALNDMDVQLDENREDITIGGSSVNFDDEDLGNEPAHAVSIRTGGGQRDVTLTLPDGRRTTFYFNLVPGGGDSAGSLWNAVWQPAPGVKATLTTQNPSHGNGEIGDNTLVAIPIGGLQPYWQMGGPKSTLENYDFPGWILTMPDGTKYHITRGESSSITYEDPQQAGHFLDAKIYGQPKLTRIEQRSGDSIVISDDNIKHFNATNQETRRVTFHRNDRGLIDSISDPNGLDSGGTPVGYPAVKYEYDGYDNLLNVAQLVDRGAGTYLTNTFLYEYSQFPHYITRIIDPRGIGIVRNLYDDSGKLIGMIDAAGNTNRFEHDLVNRREVHYDRSGQPTIHRYDTRGNVVGITDALGHTNAFAYDDNGYLTNSIDALGHVTSFVNDANGNVLSVTVPYPVGADPAAYTTAFTWDTTGNQTSVILPSGGVVTNVYDANTGNLLETRDEAGNLISSTTYNAVGLTATEGDKFGTNHYCYDSAGNMTAFTNSLGGVTTSGYDANGNLTTLTDSSDVSTVNYDAMNRETASDYGHGITMNYGYADAGDWSSANGPTIGHMERKMDDQGRLSGWNTANGSSPGFAYDVNGRLEYETNSIGVVTRSVYNAVGWLVAKTNLTAGSGMTYGYDAAGRKIVETNAYGQATTFDYWPSGSLKAMTNAMGAYWNYTDAAGACSACGSSGAVTDYFGRVVESVTSSHDLPLQTIRRAYAGATGSSAATNSIVYLTGLTTPEQEAADYPSSVTDEGGRTRHYGYTTLGQLYRATDSSGANWWTNQFDDNGVLTNVLSPTGESLSYAYDELDNVKAIRFGDGNRLTNYYNAANRLSGVRLPSGVALTNFYDFAGRLTNRASTFGENASFAYNGNDAITVMSDNTGSTTNLYDAAGRFCGMDHPGGASVRYALDLLNRIVAITNKASAGGTAYVTKYLYDAVGNITNVGDPFNGQTSFEYDQVRRKTKRTLPNGIVTTYQYNWKDQVTNIVHKTSGGTTLASVAYDRAPGGEPVQITREDGTYVMLAYDAALRLTNEIYFNSGGTPQTTNGYAYDAAGNRIRLNKGGTVLTNSVFAGYQITAVKQNGSTVESYTYDSGGREISITRDSQTLNLGYNSADQVTAFTNNTAGTWVTYQHDARGRRMISTNSTGMVRRFLVAPTPGSDLESPQLIANASGSVQQGYVYFGDQPILSYSTSGASSYYLEDGMGSVIGLAPASSPSTANTTRLFYDGFGNSTATNGPAPTIASGAGGDFRFHGAWWESGSSLYNMRAREYDARMGRFTSRDQDIGTFEAPETLYPYAFANDNAYVYSDPSGHFTLAEMDVVSAIQSVVQAGRMSGVAAARRMAFKKLGEIARDQLITYLKSVLPLDQALESLGINAKQAGAKFQSLTEDILCALPLPPDAIWLEPHVKGSRGPNGDDSIDGEVVDSGIGCKGRDTAKRAGGNIPRPDFIISLGDPQKSKGLLIGEIKLSGRSYERSYLGLKGSRGPKQLGQWNAIIGYAKKNTFTDSALLVSLYKIPKPIATQLRGNALSRGVNVVPISVLSKSSK